jgi:mannose-6-phosphate isomerase-like protein (cupin superfamily)
MTEKINLNHKFSLFSEHWRPKVVAALNGQEIKVIKVQGEFPWHTHETEDEFFLVWKGVFRVEFRDHVVSLGAGECVVVPHGVERAPHLRRRGSGNSLLRAARRAEHRQRD